MERVIYFCFYEVGIDEEGWYFSACLFLEYPKQFILSTMKR